MSKYVLVRGWFECDFEQVNVIKRINDEYLKYSVNDSLQENVLQLYSKGWSYPPLPINWVSVVSLGININQTALDYIKNMVINVSKIEALDGYFRVDDDEGEVCLEWIVKNGNLEVKIFDS
ncbi:hypothetical protein [Escherichia fergusonii]|uniref:hypothetical protein n=1 Tax=Escherichia fergusonii TaxID=564 RepID=UPI00201DC6D3|nr:hypothetical protein [Escherichia fergusonii]URA05070.1 hypothetical protein MYF53_06210 [Escherichia fergusonii]